MHLFSYKLSYNQSSLNNLHQLLNVLMSISPLNTTPEVNSQLDFKNICISEEANQAFLATAIYINRLHYEELLLKARIRELNKIFEL